MYTVLIWADGGIVREAVKIMISEKVHHCSIEKISVNVHLCSIEIDPHVETLITSSLISV